MKRNLLQFTAVALAVGALSMPALAATTHSKVLKEPMSQVGNQITVNDAATNEGEGAASGAPTGLSGQVMTGDLDADFSRDNNRSNGTATNVRPT
jgi:hypothetical protein